MHEGHRRRMYEKLKNDSLLEDHELLEILLFNAFQRKNTNPIAHALLDRFGTLSGVFGADYNKLITVDGVGENVAPYIKCIAECKKRVAAEFVGIAVLKNYDDFKNFTIARLRGKPTEVLEIYCLDKNGKVTSINSFTNNDENKVEVESDKIASIIATHKPHGILVAHNHLSGVSLPSVNDDLFTTKIYVLCNVNNVNLYDHCIYASDSEVFSYYLTGTLDKIKDNFKFDLLIKDRFGYLAEKKE